jgi:hypothetical protein
MIMLTVICGLQLQGPLEGLGGFRVTPGAPQDQAKVEPGLRLRRIDRQRLAERLLRLAVATGLLLAGADGVPHFGVVGLAPVLDGRQFPAGGRAFATQRQRLRQLAAQAVGLGRQARGNPIARRRVVTAAGGGRQIAPAFPDRGFARRVAQSGGEGVRRLVVAPQDAQGLAEQPPSNSPRPD